MFPYRCCRSFLIATLLMFAACAEDPESDPEGSRLFLKGQSAPEARPVFVWTRGAAPFDGSNWDGAFPGDRSYGNHVAFLVGAPPAPGPQRDVSEAGKYGSEPRIATGYFIADLEVERCGADGSCSWTASGIDPSLVVVHLDRPASRDTCAARRLGGQKAQGLHLMRATPVSVDEGRAAAKACIDRAGDDGERKLCECEHAGDKLEEVGTDTRFRIQTGAIAQAGEASGLRSPVVMR